MKQSRRQQLRRHLSPHARHHAAEPRQVVVEAFRRTRRLGVDHQPKLSSFKLQRIDAVRAVFGDDRIDYAEALERHYGIGSMRPGWETEYVTPYAASHPWEDWAESWAHYLHIMDTLETAAAQGLRIEAQGDGLFLADPFERDFASALDDWHALRTVLNSLNRSMGLADAYPFVISPTIAEKLTFIHNWIRSSR